MKSLFVFLSALCIFPVPAQTIDTAQLHPIEEVVVSGKPHIKRMGRDVRSQFCAAVIPSETGAECGIACHTGKRTLLLGKLNIWCYTQKIDTLIFQLRLYPLKKGIVGERLSHNSVYIPIPPGVKFTQADLRPYDLHVKGDFLLALECIHIRVHESRQWEPFDGVSFNSSLLSRSYFRTTKNPVWKSRKPGIGLSVEGYPVTP